MTIKGLVTFAISGLLVVVGVVFLLIRAESVSYPPHKTIPNKTDITVNLRGVRWGIGIGFRDDILDTLQLYALTNCSKHLIYLRGDLNYENQRDAIIHELLHAGTCDNDGNSHNMFYNSTNEVDHEGIYKIATFLTSLLDGNPELALYLAGQ